MLVIVLHVYQSLAITVPSASTSLNFFFFDHIVLLKVSFMLKPMVILCSAQEIFPELCSAFFAKVQQHCCCCSVAQLCPTLCDPMDYSLPGFSVCGVSRQEYGSVLPFPSPWDLYNSGIKPASPALAGRFFITEPLGKLIGPFTMIQITVKLPGTQVEGDLNIALNMAATDETDQHFLTGKDY